MIDLTRRGAIGTTISGIALAAMPMPSSAAAGRGETEADLSPSSAISRKLNSWLADAPLFNREHAARVLAESDLDALLISNPVSIYHLTGISPVTNRMFPRPFEAYALLMADPRQPVRILLNDFTYYYLASDERPGTWLETRLYSSPAAVDDGSTSPQKAAAPTMLRLGPNADLSKDEMRRRDEIAAMTSTITASAELGLTAMLRDAGLAGKRVASDSFVANLHAERAGLQIDFADPARPLGLIRRIKSLIEIDLMRHAASTNAEAAVAAAQEVRAGASLADLRSAYFSEAAQRGGDPTFMAIDRATSTRYDRQLRDGQAFLIDGVSGFNGYHGDFGRTVFLGEPDRKMAAVVAEMAKSWQAIRAKMLVGSTYGDLIEAGQDALRRSSHDIFVRFGVHSIGLWHSDDPSGQSGEQYFGTRLEPGMVLSVDCPLFDEGIGGSAHYEDLTLITNEGPVALNPAFPAALMI